MIQKQKLTGSYRRIPNFQHVCVIKIQMAYFVRFCGDYTDCEIVIKKKKETSRELFLVYRDTRAYGLLW